MREAGMRVERLERDKDMLISPTLTGSPIRLFQLFDYQLDFYKSNPFFSHINVELQLVKKM